MGKHMEEQIEEKSIFKKFIIIYVTILTVLMAIFLIYVADSLIKYDKNQIENYMETIIDKLKKVSKNGKIENHVDISKINVSEYEKDTTSISEGFYELLSNKEITYKLNENSKDVENTIYDIYAGKDKILEVYLDGKQKENRLGLLTYNKWETKRIKETLETGLYTCEIQVPSNYTVYINNKEVSKDNITQKVQNEGLEQISKYVEIPYIVKYEITDLLRKPNVKILDKDGNETQYKQEENVISKDLDFIIAENQEQAQEKLAGEIDVLKVAKDWSLYLTDDLEGRLHGYYNISQYLIDGSNIKQFAHKWATGVDITFVSNHTLLNPTFTNEKVSNFEIYNENAFSCEVYLQKNLKLVSGGKIIEDKMNERMYFAYYDETNDGKDNPTWKLVNMQSVAANKE